MSYHPDLSAAERDEIEQEALERLRNDGKASRAERLYSEVQARNGDHRFDMLELELGLRIEEGRDLLPAEEASVWDALWREVVEMPGLPQEEDGRAMPSVRNKAAVAPQEREPMKVNDAFPGTYLKQADLKGKRVMVTIDRVEVEDVGQGQDQEQKPVVYFKGAEKGFVLNRGNADTIVGIVGDDETDNWGGHKIVLYVDPSVMYAGKKTGGIRVAPPPAGHSKTPPPPPPQTEVVDGFQASDDDVPF